MHQRTDQVRDAMQDTMRPSMRRPHRVRAKPLGAVGGRECGREVPSGTCMR